MGEDLKLPPQRRSRQARVAWPVEAWPEADRLAWARANAAGDLLDDCGAAADWREATRHSAVGAYGRWLAHLASLRITVDDETSAQAWGGVLNLARSHALTAYDAAYLELALRRGLPLATLDDRLRTAAQATGVAAFVP